MDELDLLNNQMTNDEFECPESLLHQVIDKFAGEKDSEINIEDESKKLSPTEQEEQDFYSEVFELSSYLSDGVDTISSASDQQV